MKYYVIFGPPGAGKGTHSVPLVRDYNLCHISTGDLLRAEISEGTELGLKAKALIDAGQFVPDSVVESMIEGKFNSVKGVDGFLLDGFPRTISQAQDLDRMLEARGEKINGVISLMIDDEMIHTRIKFRANIEGRADDANDETIKTRIKTYHDKTEPLIAYYKEQNKYAEVNGYGGEGEPGKAIVYSHIREVMEKFED